MSNNTNRALHIAKALKFTDMKDIFKGIESYDTNQLMLVFDHIMESYKLFKKYEDRRHKCGYKWLLIGLTDRKEDNLIALATLDCLNAFKDKAEDIIPYYTELGRALIQEISLPKYDANRGKEGFLINKGF